MSLLNGDFIDSYILILRRFLFVYLVVYLLTMLLIDTLFSNKRILGNGNEKSDILYIKYGLMHFILDIILLLPFILTSVIVLINRQHVDLNTLVVYTLVLMVSLVYSIFLILNHINLSVSWSVNKNTIILKNMFNKKVMIDLDTISSINKCLYYDIIVYNNKETAVIFNKLDSKNTFIDGVIKETLNRNPFMVIK